LNKDFKNRIQKFENSSNLEPKVSNQLKEKNSNQSGNSFGTVYDWD
jgi:hypothetical protein